jgi:hypothetical protein
MRIMKLLLFVLGVALFGCGAASQELLPMSGARPRPIKPMYTAPRLARAIGRQAMEDIGYEKIIELAVKAEWLQYPKPDASNLVGQAAEAATFWPVFTRYAVVAGITSQADSPAPGPADAIGVGVIVVGLVDAGMLGGMLLRYVDDTQPAPSSAAASAGAATAGAAAAGAVSVAGAEALRRRKKWENECQEELNKCLLTDLAGEPGGVRGETRCYMCYQGCKGTGSWPSRMEITRDTPVSCEYWKPKWQR